VTGVQTCALPICLHQIIVRDTLCAGAQSAPPKLAGEASVRRVCFGNNLTVDDYSSIM